MTHYGYFFILYDMSKRKQYIKDSDKHYESAFMQNEY
jgi:hypothetical protein